MRWFQRSLWVLCACGRIDFDARADGAIQRANDANIDAVPRDVPQSGFLAGSGQEITGAFDLTSEGTVDWALWGATSTTDFDHKASGGGLISNFTALGGGTAIGYGNTYNNEGLVGFTWSDGTPAASSGPAQYCGVYVAGYGQGVAITVPAEILMHTLLLYVGGDNATGQLTAQLSDRSAPDLVSTLVNPGGVYTITYRSASDGATLSLSWIQVTTAGSGVDVNLSAAALQ